MKQLLLCAIFALAACAPDTLPQQEAVGYSTLPPVQRDYKTLIANWGRNYYASPRAIASPAISDPVLIRDSLGRLLWLVCVRAENLGRGGAMPGPEVQAFGFAPNFFSAPLNRNGVSIVSDYCAEHPLTYRPFPELARG